MNSQQVFENAFHSSDEETRRKAIQDLRGTPLGQTAALLFMAMGDQSWRVRKEAVEVFVSSDPDEALIVSLLELLRSPENAGLRNSAAEAVIRLGVRAVAPLIRIVDDADPDVRKFVIDVMGGIGSAEFITPLLAALQDSDVNVASAAAEHLGNIGDPGVVPELIRSTVCNETDLFRFNALAAIGKLAAPAPVPEEIRRLADKDILRKAVYECLGSIADETAVPLLLEGLGVRQKSSRNAAVLALIRIYNRSGAESRKSIESTLRALKGGDRVPVLLELFDPAAHVLSEAIVVLLDIIGDRRSVGILLRAFSVERLSGCALKALKHLGPDGIDTLISQFSTADASSRSAICALIGECAYRNGEAVISDALCDPSPLVRKSAVSAAGRLGLTNCIPGIVRLLDDHDQEVRNTVVSCLQALALIDRSGIQAVARQLGDSDLSEQRRNAAVLFAALGDGDRLMLLVKDEDAQVRQAAVTSVGKLHMAASSSIMMIALVDEDPDVRIAAAEALGEVGDSGVVTALSHALNDEDPWVQCAVLKSLAMVFPEGTIDAVQTVFPKADGIVLITCLDLLEAEGSDLALDLVEKCLDNPDEEVVSLALSILGSHAVERILPYADKLLNHAGWNVRAACARTVARLPAIRSRSLLEAALEREDNDLVREQIQTLIKGLA